MGDRPHQAGVRHIVDKLHSGGADQHHVILNVVPGGGKSACAPIMCQEMKARDILPQQVIWVVPRLTLQEQSAQAFDGPWGAGLKPLASSINDFKSRSQLGFTTNYMKLSMGLDAHCNVVQDRTLLVIDEGHHCRGIVDNDNESAFAAPDSAWARNLDELKQHVIKKGGHTLMMTGTAWRNSKEPIYGLPYNRMGSVGGSSPNSMFGLTTQSISKWDDQFHGYVEMLRPAGLECNAIVPIDFHLIDGTVSWTGGSETPVAYGPYRLSEMTLKDPVAGAVRTFVDASANLDTTVRTVVDQALLDRHKESKGRQKGNGQVIVVAKSCKDAKLILDYIKARHPSVKSALAVSKNMEEGENEDGTNNYSDFSEEARDNLEAFKSKRIAVVVTVAMAYEGMDAPGCDRLVHLGTYRSSSWMMQCLARVWRHGGWKTKCHVYAPNDVRMRNVIDAVSLINPETAEQQDESRFFRATGRHVQTLTTAQKATQKAENKAAAERFADAVAVADTALPGDPIEVGGSGGGGRIFLPEPSQLLGWKQYLNV